MASYNLEDGAQLWYMQLQREGGTPSWRHFSELLNIRYGSPLRSNPLGELAACTRTGSVVDFQDRFESLLPHAGTLSEAQKVQLFTAGLLPPISLDVEFHNPQSLTIAMSLARKLELRDQCVRPTAQGSSLFRSQSRGILPAPPVRAALPTPSPVAAPTPAPTPVTSVDGRQVRRLDGFL